MDTNPTGKIITFYSYKGGTGRSMMLANIAWILASNGKRVLVVDWDLEAPGLHRYFRPFLADKDLSTSEGLIDFVIDFAVEAMTPDRSSSKPQREWFKPYANILRYAASLDYEFPSGGTLDYVPSGRQDYSYSTKVNSFNWQDFYERFGGGVFLEAAKEKMKSEYDYILIDSRTGVSDTSGICTVQMPDILVVCFTLNNQSIEGSVAVAESVFGQRKQSGIRIFPIPTRVEINEKSKLELRRKYARYKFTGFPAHINSNEREIYWGDVEVLYIPFYAYEEILATFGDKPGQRNSLLASAERITSYITEGEIEKLVRPSEPKRQEVLKLYEDQPIPSLDEPSRAPGSGIFICYRRDDSAAHAGRLYDRLSSHFGEDHIFMDIDMIEPGEDFVSVIEQAVTSCNVLIAIIGRSWVTVTDSNGRRRLDNPDDFVRLELVAALKRNVRVIPVLIQGASMPRSSDLPEDLISLSRRQAFEISDVRWKHDVDNLISSLERVLEKL